MATTPPFSPPWTRASRSDVPARLPCGHDKHAADQTATGVEDRVSTSPACEGTPLVPSNWNDVPNAQLPLTQMRHREDCGAAGRKEPGSLGDHKKQRAPHPHKPPPSKHSDGKNPTSSWRTDKQTATLPTDAGGQTAQTRPRLSVPGSRLRTG